MSVEIPDPPFPTSPVVPAQLEGDHVISFRCHKGIGCWNACCSNIDITLTPYDILRLKNRLGLNSREFLRQYTFPYEMEKDGLAGVKFKPVEGGTACQFMTEEGCSVYEDRPTACRYYPVGLLAMRRADEYTDRQYYAFVEEEHCLGHQEDRKLSIDEYRKEQGLIEYDELSRGWRQLVLKKKSSGPTVGTPSKRSRQLFFMACYDLDSFREFIRSQGFRDSFDVPEDEYAKLMEDDTELMLFAFRFLKQVMFGEESIPVKADALAAREARRKALAEEEARRKADFEAAEGAFDAPMPE